MRNGIAALFGAVLFVSSAGNALAQPVARSDQSAKVAEAHAIIEIMFPPFERQHMVDKMVDDLTKTMAQTIPVDLTADPGLKSLLDEAMAQSLAEERPIISKHMPKVLEAMEVAYTREFSLAELKEIRAFAQTPAGTHYLSKSTAMIGDPDVMKANSAMFAEAEAMIASMRPELEDKVIAYVKAHPEAAEKIGGQADQK
jgi:hypothetical protein